MANTHRIQAIVTDLTWKMTLRDESDNPAGQGFP